MKITPTKILNGVPILLLTISYCLFVYLFVTKEGLLENQIGRVTSVIDVGGIAGIAFRKKLLKRYLSAYLWVGSFVILAATVVQALAVSKLHGVLATVVVSGEPAAIENSALDVYFLDGVPDLRFHSKEDDTTFLYRTSDRVLIWEQPKTVVATEKHSGAEARASLEWPLESIFDIGGERVVSLRLQLETAEVRVVVNPSDAAISLTTYLGEDTTGYHELSSGQSQFVSLGDKISIIARRRGYYTGYEDLGLEAIRGDTTVRMSLSRKPSSILVEAYNIGGQPVPAAVVSVGGELTEHRAFERFELPWDKPHDIAVEFMRGPHDTLRSKTQRVTLGPDTLIVVKCTLQYIN